MRYFILREIPFTGVIGVSNVVSRANTAGRHLTYLPKYVLSTDPLLQEPDDRLSGGETHRRHGNPLSFARPVDGRPARTLARVSMCARSGRRCGRCVGVPIALRVHAGLKVHYDSPYTLMAVMGANVNLNLVVGGLLLIGYVVAMVISALA